MTTIVDKIVEIHNEIKENQKKLNTIKAQRNFGERARKNMIAFPNVWKKDALIKVQSDLYELNLEYVDTMEEYHNLVERFNSMRDGSSDKVWKNCFEIAMAIVGKR